MVKKFKLGNLENVVPKENIKRTLEIADDYAGELSIEVLPLEKIELDPDNRRELTLTLDDALSGIKTNDPDYDKKKQDWKSLESLAKTIKDNKLINPISVYRYANKCRLIAGERRTLASAIAGKKEIIARISNQRPVGTKLRILQWIENNERSDLSLYERILSLEDIVREHFKENKQEDGKLTAKLLSDLTAVSPTQARRYIIVLNSNGKIREGIKSGKLENIKLIELICSAKEEYQNEILESALSGYSHTELVKLKKSLESSQVKKQTRGRKKTNVNLGKVQGNVAKVIMQSIINEKTIINSKALGKLKALFNKEKWVDNCSIEKTFQQAIKLVSMELEKN